MDAFDELGRTIHGKWRRADFDNRAFPEIACDALHAWDLPGRITYDDVIDWVAEADVLPTQTDLEAAFGQPSGGRVLRFTLFYRGVVLDQRHDRRSPALVLGRLYRALRVERSEPVRAAGSESECLPCSSASSTPRASAMAAVST